MNKFLKGFFGLLILFSLIGCSVDNENNSNDEANQNKATATNDNNDSEENIPNPENEADIFKKDFKTDFDTDIDETEHAISDENFNKYNEIMDYLNEYPDTKEEVLYKELESEYNESADEIRQFVKDNMQDAIDRDMGETTNDVSLEESDIKSTIRSFFDENVKEQDHFNIDVDKADVDISNLRSISKGEFTYGSDKYDYIIKTEHTDDFQEVNVFQLKVDEVNIDLD